ncbi:MAG TPA: dihydrolipoyllysine-residue succinyltransferase [Rhabdochlamydiaceae bacterium]|nr:dihydrolipoyllysine-residue succinyltransferase [Rhabdochlamydiaceae bacterium]
MKVDITIPSLGESVTEAVIGNVLKPSGSYVKADEEILELETEKVNQVLYAPNAGQLNLTVKQGDTVKIGQVIGSVETDAKAPAAAPGAPPSQPQPPPPKPKEAPSPPPPKKEEGPSARKMAAEFVAEIKEGPKPSAPPPPSEIPRPVSVPEGKFTRKRMSSLRKVIAQRLVEAKNTTAMLTTFNEIDMSKVMEIRAKEKDNFQKTYGVKLGFMSFFVKAVVAALKAYPQVNAFIDGEDMVLLHTYDIGIAVSTEKGLMVPVLRGCEELSFGGVEKAIDGYAKKARSGTVSLDDLKGGSFTITNGGTFGSLLSTPILNPPQSAILGMHSIVKRPVVVNDEIVIRPMMYVALSYDHRIIDGREAVLFLVHIKQSLEDPARLLLDL